MRKIILHDYFQAPEGGGKLSLLLAKYLQLDLGFGFMSSRYPDYFDLGNISKQISLNSFSRIPLWKQTKLSRAFQNKTGFLHNYDKIIYSGTYAPLAVNSQYPGNIYYCHTPPRFIYDQYDYYLTMLPRWQKPLFKTFVAQLKPMYENSVSKMDQLITNSEHVKKRIAHYLGQDATVIYPPCDNTGLAWEKPRSYYLSTARLDPLKRVDLIVEAFINDYSEKSTYYWHMSSLSFFSPNASITGALKVRPAPKARN